MQTKQNKLLDNATAVGMGNKAALITTKPAIELSGSVTSGTGSAVVDILASNSGVGFGWVATITMTLSTTLATELFNQDIGSYGQITAEVKSISGPGAVLNLVVGQ